LPTIMIAEDDFLIADLLEDVLIKAGYNVCGMASTVTEAVELCNLHHPDLAVIDMRLADHGLGTDIIASLGCQSKMGILYATGNTGHVMLTAKDGEGVITKPYQVADILRALQIVSEITITGKASKPFPRNFQLLRHADPKNQPGVDVHGSGI